MPDISIFPGKPVRQDAAAIFLLFLLIQIGSLRTYLKYPLSHVTHSLALSTMLFIFPLVFLLVLLSIKRLAATKTPGRYLAVFFLLTAMMVLYVYPIADGLKVQMRGSDQDDCVINSIHNLLQGTYPYSKSYYGNPCSTGFGMLVFYLPFTAGGIYELGSVAAVFLLYFYLRRYEADKRVGENFIAVFFSSLLVWELLAVGSDLIMLGCMMALCVLLSDKAMKNGNTAMLLLAALLCGLVASTRISFIVVPVLLSLLYWRYRKNALIFLTVAMLVALVPSLAIYLQFGELAPLHLLGRSATMLPGPYRAISAFVLMLVTSVVVYRVSSRRLDSAEGFLFILLALLVPVSLGDLINLRRLDFATWEGANYLLPLMPLASILLARRLVKFTRPADVSIR